jgi:hypothetical protein
MTTALITCRTVDHLHYLEIGCVSITTIEQHKKKKKAGSLSHYAVRLEGG